MAPKSKFKNRSMDKLSSLSIITFFGILSIVQVNAEKTSDCFSPSCVHFQKNNSTNPVKVLSSDPSKEKILFNTFCYDGLPKSLLCLWANPVLRIIQKDVPPSEGSKLLTYYGVSKADVDLRRKQPGYAILQTWAASLRTFRQTEDFSLNPFNVSCIGIETNVDYTARINIKAIDLWYVTYLVAGVVIFFSAKTWSQNTTLHYGTGVSVGVLASLIVLVFLIARVLPSRLKNLGYLLMLTGTSMAFWFVSCMSRMVSDNMMDSLVDYWQYVLAYCICTGLLSFAIVYRYGPVTNERTLNLIQWLLQIIGLILIYNSTQIQEVSIALVILTLTVYNFPRTLLFNRTSRMYWNRLFPPRPKLLTEDEYIAQGNAETTRALEQLREYCRSPECKSWTIISKLKSPQRFAEFVQTGSVHFTGEEMLEHEISDDQSLLAGNQSLLAETQSVGNSEQPSDTESELVFVLGSPAMTVSLFADFVEGNSWHVSNAELLEYDSETDLQPPHEMSGAGDADMGDDNESEMDFILSSP